MEHIKNTVDAQDTKKAAFLRPFGYLRCYVEASLAETPGFEPGEPHSGLDGLANRWFQPLTHVSGPQRRARPIALLGMGGKGWAIFFQQGARVCVRA